MMISIKRVQKVLTISALLTMGSLPSAFAKSKICPQDYNGVCTPCISQLNKCLSNDRQALSQKSVVLINLELNSILEELISVGDISFKNANFIKSFLLNNTDLIRLDLEALLLEINDLLEKNSSTINKNFKSLGAIIRGILKPTRMGDAAHDGHGNRVGN